MEDFFSLISPHLLVRLSWTSNNRIRKCSYGLVILTLLKWMGCQCFLLQALPIKLSQGFLKEIRNDFLKFVWASKPARLCRSMLSLPKVRGGLGFPTWLSTRKPHFYLGWLIGLSITIKKDHGCILNGWLLICLWIDSSGSRTSLSPCV